MERARDWYEMASETERAEDQGRHRGHQEIYNGLIADYVNMWPGAPLANTGAWDRRNGQHDMLIIAAMLAFGDEKPGAIERVAEDLQDRYAAMAN